MCIRDRDETICLPIHGINDIEQYIDKTVICGIRPESINDLDPSLNKSSVEREVVVDVVEPAGSDTFAVVELGEKQIVARLNGNSKVLGGEKVKLTFDLSQTVFFDSETEDRIR